MMRYQKIPTQDTESKSEAEGIELTNRVVAINPSERFVDKFSKSLQEAIVVAKELSAESILPTIINEIMRTMTITVSGKFLGLVVPKVESNTVAYGGLLLGVWLGYRNIASKSEAIAKSRKIKNFFDNSVDIESWIVTPLNRTFLFCIQMLEIGEGGLDRLINYFISSIFDAVDQYPPAKEVTQENLFSSILLEIFKQNKIERISLKTTYHNKYNLNWNLAGLVYRSPIFSVIEDETLKKVYHCNIHLAVGNKRRDLVRQVPASDLYKYPPIIIVERSHLKLVPNREYRRGMVPPKNCQINTALNMKNCDLSVLIHQFYFNLRSHNRNPEPVRLEKAISDFKKLSGIIIENKMSVNIYQRMILCETLRAVWFHELSDKFAGRCLAAGQSEYNQLSSLFNLTDEELKEAKKKKRQQRATAHMKIKRVTEREKQKKSELPFGKAFALSSSSDEEGSGDDEFSTQEGVTLGGKS